MKRLVKLLVFIILFFTIAFMACNKEKESFLIMTIASRMVKGVEPTGNAERDYMLVKYEKSAEWEMFSPRIYGFNYVEGYEYMLLVKKVTIKNPPMDHYGATYMLLEVISVIEKESDIPLY